MASVSTIGKLFSVQFLLYPTTYTVDTNYNNIILLTEGGACCEVGQRIPGFWAFPVSSSLVKFLVIFAINGDGNMESSFTLASNEIKTNSWHLISMSQIMEGDKYFFVTSVNNVTKVKVENNTPREYKNVEIWLSDNFHIPQAGYVKNLRIYSKSIFIFTISEMLKFLLTIACSLSARIFEGIYGYKYFFG